MLRHFASVGMALVLCACNTEVDHSTNDSSDDSRTQTSTGDSTFQQWRLPERMREISGLALTPDQRLLAVSDEEAIVYELDFESGALVKSFALGDPTLRGDFEGIAVLDQKVWLLTSDGQLFVTSEGGDGERMNFGRFDTGLGSYCELEGLAQDIDSETLLLACKKTRSSADDLKLIRFSVADNKILPEGDIIVTEAIAGEIGKKHIRPSGIAIDPVSGNSVLVASNHKALVTLAPDGDLINAIILPGRNRHRQPEGIEVTKDGRLLIADEGGNGRARLAVYRWTGNGLEPE